MHIRILPERIVPLNTSPGRVDPFKIRTASNKSVNLKCLTLEVLRGRKNKKSSSFECCMLLFSERVSIVSCNYFLKRPVLCNNFNEIFLYTFCRLVQGFWRRKKVGSGCCRVQLPNGGFNIAWVTKLKNRNPKTKITYCVQGARGIAARFLKWSPASTVCPIMTKFSQYTPYSTCYLVLVSICRQD